MTEHAEAAKAIRAELKKAFPSIKFTVRSQSYSMGDHVSIQYQNGVPTDKVDEIVKKYQYGNFDGMNDIYNNDNEREDIPQTKYVLVERSYTEEAREKVKKDIAVKYGIKDVNNEQEWRQIFNDWSTTVVNRKLSEMTF